MTFVYIFVIAFFLWPLIKAVVLGTIIGKIIRKCSRKEWKTALDILSNFLTARADRNVFISYLLTMEGFAGILPSLLSSVLEFSNQDYCVRLSVKLEDNADWVSAILGLLTTIGYVFYLRSKYLPTSKDWKQMANSINQISSHIVSDFDTEWFDSQYDRSIKSLGTRYSEMINFPIDDMPMALAVTARDGHLLFNLLENDYNKFSERLRALHGTTIDTNKLDKLYGEYSKLQNLFVNFKVADILTIVNTIEKLNEDCQALRYDEKGVYKNDYSINQLCDAIDGLYQKTSGQWFSFLQKNTLVIAGIAGIGKSHFLGELLTQRHKAKMATLLVTGKSFNSASEPLSQLCSHFDYVGKKEMFLKELNEYGRENNQRVLIIIDGINEGAGADFWKNHLDDFVHQIESFDNLGLILSVRTSSSHNWAYELAHNDEFAIFEHKGFQGNIQFACEYFFRSFNLDFPCWPVIGEEYSNPLFLIKYCRSHQLSGLPLYREDFWTTINNYCTEVNKVLAQLYHYDAALNLVFDSLVKVAELMVARNKRWSLEYKNVIDELSEVAKYVDQPTHFLDYLIDEGLLQMDVNNGTALIDFGYERFCDFFISYYLVEKNKYWQWLSENNIDLHALSILVPKLLGKELYEDAPNDKRHDCYSAFFETLPYRESITSEASSLLCNLPSTNRRLAILTSFRCLTRNDYPLNATTLYDLLYNNTLAKRDSLWTICVSEEYGEFSDCASSLVEWGYSVSQTVLASMDDSVLELCAEGLLWILSTTNQKLRDKATHTIVNITIGRPLVMEHLITKFSRVNDPYIQERLWAAIYGSVLCSQSVEIASRIAKIAYKIVFDVDHVAEDILVRDFAKGIIEYAKYLDSSLNIPLEKLKTPFNKVNFPTTIPDGKEINNRYKLDYDATNDKDVFIAQQAILSSMATEHDTCEPMYGDFGRYVFQSHISAFKVNPMQMSWWAIAMIFEDFGYNAELFAKFDSTHQSHSRGFHNIERIGKKYQRISLNRIIAILTDVYPNIKGDSWDNPWLVQRSIDPTLAPLGLQTDDRNDRYSVPQYDLFAIKDDNKWMRATYRMPPISNYLQTSDSSGEKWINLFSYNTIEKHSSNITEFGLTRNLWVFVQSFIVDKKHLRKTTNAIYKYGLDRFSFHENREIFHLYIREFFWSSNYRKTIEEAGFSHIPFQIGSRCWDDIITEPTYLQYQKDSSEDSSTEESIGMLLPNQCLFEGLNLMYAKENGAWVDKNGKLTCYDNFVYGHGHSALLVRQSALIDYLKQKDKALVWPILIERMLKTENGFGSNYVHFGGYAYLMPNGKIKYKYRSYEPTRFSKWKAKQKIILKKNKNEAKLFLTKYRIVK